MVKINVTDDNESWLMFPEYMAVGKVVEILNDITEGGATITAVDTSRGSFEVWLIMDTADWGYFYDMGYDRLMEGYAGYPQ